MWGREDTYCRQLDKKIKKFDKRTYCYFKYTRFIYSRCIPM
jgi:hypothetical protein